MLVAVATGITAALLAVPALRGRACRDLGGVHPVARLQVATAPPLAARAAAADAPSLAGGTLFGVANPKAWVAIAAVFASARVADTAIADEAAKIAVLGLLIVLIHVGWLLAGATLAPALREPEPSPRGQRSARGRARRRGRVRSCAERPRSGRNRPRRRAPLGECFLLECVELACEIVPASSRLFALAICSAGSVDATDRNTCRTAAARLLPV